jgi:anti-sigma regulatory factor (Ser/Thr protein kinase)
MEVALKMRPPSAQQRFVIDDASKVGEARRAAQTLANFEFTAELAGKVAIAATELANNLLRHAGSGELLLQLFGDEGQATLELLALDRGPGMEDVARCLQDGYSTAGTPGTGLGAVRRLAREFDIHSHPGQGTAVLARFGAQQPATFGVVNIALEGEMHCGDAWALQSGSDGIAFMVVDGLGHGTFAAEAAHAAIELFNASPFQPPAVTIDRCNGALSRTRGGAASCGVLKPGALSFAGLGNVAGVLVTPGRSQGLMTHNGTLGLGQRRAQQFEYDVEPGALLVVHSDGVSTRWDLKNRPDLLHCHPALIAGVLYRDHARDRDDATVLVVRP